uniref:LIM zinc-binding domain-containing protein n=1 Tax=Nothobranchius furzeri TaxID=105023 RepID=A0A8C6LD51_NOTFU
MNPQCARCGKIVYPTEKVSCLDKNWHKGCFHCEVCKMTLNMKNYKGYDKKPYCSANKQSLTFLMLTPCFCFYLVIFLSDINMLVISAQRETGTLRSPDSFSEAF